MGLRKEAQDIADKWTEVREDGDLTPQEVHELAREVFEFTKSALSVGDSQEDRDGLADEIENLINTIAGTVLADRPIIRGIVFNFTDDAAGRIVYEISKYAGSAQDFWSDKVDPILSRWEKTIHAARSVGG